MRAELKIYVADLADYNDGKLTGRWIAVSDFNDEETLATAMRAVLSHPDHELVIHDSEGIEIGQNESADNLMQIKRACEEHGLEKVNAFLRSGFNEGGVTDLSEQISERDLGEYASEEDWAEQHISECYDLDKMLGNLARYFDYAAFARDAELGGDVTFLDLGYRSVWVLDNH